MLAQSRIELLFLLLFALVGLWLYRYFAIRYAWFDVPNERSSHKTTVPGGAGIVLALLFSLFLMLEPDALQATGLTALQWGVLCTIALVGWVDDRLNLPRGVRALIYAVYTLFAVHWTGFAPHYVSILMSILLVLSVFYFINAFNFMDGIDGIAASQALFYCLAVLLLGHLFAYPVAVLPHTALALLCGVFLLWNWAPAKLFLGDAGSLFLGLMIATLALVSAGRDALPLAGSVILMGLFLVDSAVTILQRAWARERVFDAHRSHVYQLLAQRWRSHAKVSLLYSTINLLALLPATLWACSQPEIALEVMSLSLCILAIFIFLVRRFLLSSLPGKI